ncbi:hypothetical protein D915_002885, partial [Fasciola hepatica]
SHVVSRNLETTSSSWNSSHTKAEKSSGNFGAEIRAKINGTWQKVSEGVYHITGTERDIKSSSQNSSQTYRGESSVSHTVQTAGQNAFVKRPRRIFG